MLYESRWAKGIHAGRIGHCSGGYWACFGNGVQRGRDLIDGAKVKNMQAQLQQGRGCVQYLLREVWRFSGGWLCVGALAGGATLCAGVRNGALDTADEATASLQILQNANILAAADINSVFGQSWSVSVSVVRHPLIFAANTNYLTVGGVAANVCGCALCLPVGPAYG